MILIKTKLTGLNGIIAPNRTDKWDSIEYLKKAVKNSRNGDYSLHISDFFDSQVIKSLSFKEDSFNKNPGLDDLVDYEIRHGDGEFQYHMTLIMNKSVLAKVKRLYKDLLLTTSALDGLRGQGGRRTGNFYYDLLIDCNDSGSISDGVLRLVRAVNLLENKLHKGK